jgi:hypothetical protein
MVTQKYRGMRFNSIADGVADLLRRAEGNQVSHLEFADRLVDLEQLQRNQKPIGLNLRKAGLPTDKREALEPGEIKGEGKKHIARILKFDLLVIDNWAIYHRPKHKLET